MKLFLSLMLAISIHGSLYAGIVGYLTESTASGRYFNLNEEVALVEFNSPRINEVFGSRNFGSAGSFDSTSDLDGETILFQNGNASFGSQAFSTSRTVVDITFENTGTDALLPSLNSQILPGGMGFYMSDCQADNLRNCESRSETDFGFDGISSIVRPGGVAISTMFNFMILAADDTELFSLTGSLSLVMGENGNPNTIVREFSGIDGFLTNFRESSPIGNQQQITFDWDATDFTVELPGILGPGLSRNIRYITEVTTFTDSNCVLDDEPCPLAFGSIGDPIGRGGAGGSRVKINGFNPGLYRMAASFDDGILTYRALTGPGISVTNVPAPAPLLLLLMSAAYLMFSRKRYLK
jgi:hypothetical protein